MQCGRSRSRADALQATRLAMVFLAAACVAAPDGTARAAGLPLTREQMEARAAGGHWLFVYGTGDPASLDAQRARVMRIASRLFDQDSSTVRPDVDVTDADLATHAVFLVGGPRENGVTRRLAGRLPVRFEGRGFTWFGTRYDRPHDAIHLVYPNPLDPRRFLLLVAANSPEALAMRWGGFGFGDDDWRIYRDGEVQRTGSFAQKPGDAWRYDPALDHDREKERREFIASLVDAGVRGIHVRGVRGATGLAAARAGAEVVLARLDAMGLEDPRKRTATLTVYPSLERMGEITRDTRPEHVDAAGALHAALPFGRRQIDGWSVAAARFAALGADPDSPWLEPAAAWISGRFEGEPIEVEIGRLYFGRLLPNADDAASRPTRWRSPLVWIPARAVLARAIYDAGGKTGPRAVRALLRPDPPGTLDSLCHRAGVHAAFVRKRYAALADSLGRIGRAAAAARRVRPWQSADGFQRGVCLAHAVNLERGYLSAGCAGEIERLRDLGADWIALTPFGYLPSTHTPSIRPSTDGGPDEETDESIVEAGAHAHALGFKVWLKPHLWTRGWIGELEFTPSGWDAFFEQYREFLLHQALLAEREGFEGLIVGHELVTASLRFPDRWRALIGDVRRVYGGLLTYGANWGPEVEGIRFWDALDLVGVSFYPPLASAPTRSVDALRTGAAKALADLKAISDRTGKPMLLTEVGYAPTAEAPVRPWEEQRGKPDLEMQRACYEAVVRALDGQRWVAGVFFWKWFSSPAIGGPRDSGFTPKGKPAEAVVRRAFRDWRGRSVNAEPSR